MYEGGGVTDRLFVRSFVHPFVHLFQFNSIQFIAVLRCAALRCVALRCAALSYFLSWKLTYKHRIHNKQTLGLAWS